MSKTVSVAHRGVGEGGKPVATDLIAESIVEIARGIKAIRESRLNDKALVTLLCHDTGLGVGTVKSVLASLETLEHTYLKRKPS